MEDIEALNSATVKMSHVYRALTFITKLNVRYSLEYESEQKVSYWRIFIYVNKKNHFIVYLLQHFVMVHSEREITKEIMKTFTEYIFDNWERLEDD